MKSGLEDRNNVAEELQGAGEVVVSMKSGLEDRNNSMPGHPALHLPVASQ